MIKKESRMVATPQVKDYLTAREAADYIGASLNYFYKLTASHRIPMYCPTGRKLLFKRSELQAFVEQSRVRSNNELAAMAEMEILRKREA